ncbi:hypothetical protein OPV22_021564 [Ensete ventricosum]|uniref:Epidermal patterning factor-like protein n=1 Tax=Ensete ventricosum TaxID=4639 RepID=A0AAV8QHE5_ENSVE|nr:hypothetical protein OPV22_021564 [Ensete ventricosum]
MDQEVMEPRRGRRRLELQLKEAVVLCCGFVCLFSLCALLSSDPFCQIVDVGVGSSITEPYLQAAAAEARRRQLVSGEPGSAPPRCTGKCGECTPCQPVHVALPPGTPVTTEYYPEAWRCKCGDKLYMP